MRAAGGEGGERGQLRLNPRERHTRVKAAGRRAQGAAGRAAFTAAHSIGRDGEYRGKVRSISCFGTSGREHRHDSSGQLLTFPQALLPEDADQPAATEATHAAGQRVQEPDAAGRHQRVRDREGG